VAVRASAELAGRAAHGQIWRWIHDSGTAEAIGVHGPELSAVKGLRRGGPTRTFMYDTIRRNGEGSTDPVAVSLSFGVSRRVVSRTTTRTYTQRDDTQARTCVSLL
jgi:hypothetical protein